MYIITGLGNPGKEYEGTRHNAGFMAIDHLADKYRFPWTPENIWLIWEKESLTVRK